MAALTRETIDQEHLVARYARGSLSEQEREAFEDYCVLHPEVAEQVKTDRALIEGMRELEGARTGKRESSPHKRVWAMAAGLVALGALGLWLLQGARKDLVMYAASPMRIEELQGQLSGALRIVQTRGSIVIAPEPGQPMLLLHLVVPPEAPRATFRVQLVQQAGNVEVDRAVVEQDAVTFNDERVIPIIIDSRKLLGEHLRMEVSSAGYSQTLDFRVLSR